MSESDFYLSLFAVPASGPRQSGLEERMKAFLESSLMTECLDDQKFAGTTGSASKADYLLSNRGFIAELKTLNGDPTDRVENRLRERFKQSGAPIVFGQVGLRQVVDRLDDKQAIYKAVNDLTARAVRRHLQKANEQIASTRAGLSLDSAAGILILLNDSERMIDAPNIGYSVKAAMEAVEGGYPEIKYVLVVIECHRIKLPDGREGYPMLLIRRIPTPPLDEGNYLGFLIENWGKVNGSHVIGVKTGGDWDSMSPIYDGDPPVLRPYQ